MKYKPLLYLWFLCLVSAGCIVGKSYAPPKITSEINLHTDIKMDTARLLQWFDLYKDTVLQSMIRATLDSNRDFLIAGVRIEEVKAQTAIIKANLFPQFNYQAQGGGGRAGLTARKAAGGYDGSVLNVYGAVNWELDIWGKFRSATKSARATLLTNIYNRYALQVSLVAEVASQYFLLRDLDNRLSIAQKTLDSRKEYTKLISEKFDKGYVPELDKLLAIQQESGVAATIPSIQRQIVITENAIRLLMGKGPGTVKRGYNNFEQSLSPGIPVNLPSQLLNRRPDIRSAEQALQAQFAQIGVAEANRFPAIGLTGLFGVASPQLSYLLSNGSFVANGFGSVTGPIFNFNKLKNNVTVEKKRTEEAYYQYQQTALSAFGEVDNALTILKTYSDEYEQLKIQVDVSAKALNLSTARYNYGFTSFLEVLVQEDNLFNAQLQQSASLQGKLNAVVMLYKSLGGGW